MRAFRQRMLRPGSLLPPLRLRHLPSPPLPACRFPLVSGPVWPSPTLALRLAMPALALSPASAPTTAASFSVSVLPLLRLALALILNGLAFLGGLDSLGGPRSNLGGVGPERDLRGGGGRGWCEECARSGQSD